MRLSVPTKLTASYLLIVGILVIPAVFVLRGALTRALERAEAHRLRPSLEQVRDRLAAVPASQLDRVAREEASRTGMRVTVVAADGRVLAETGVAPDRVSAVPKHGDRPEVRAARERGFGVDSRASTIQNVDLIYAATPLPATATYAGAIVRVASPADPVGGAVDEALRSLRLLAGVGMSLALVFSLLAGLSFGGPVRRLLAAGRGLVQGGPSPVERLRTGDEIEDLSVVLDELGRQLAKRLIAIGGQDALLEQAIDAVPQPALVLDAELQPRHMNGALRRRLRLDPATEEERLTRFLASPALAASVVAARRTGLPVDLTLPAIDADDGSSGPARLVPLTRPEGPPDWLLLVDPDLPVHRPEGAERVLRALDTAGRLVDTLFAGHAALRPQLAQLRQRLDDASSAAGPPEAVAVEPTPAAALVSACVEGLRALDPASVDRLSVDIESGDLLVAESAGLAARALRVFIGGALRALPAGRMLNVSVEAEPSQVRIQVDGAVPVGLESARIIARALGADAGRVPAREREAAWLCLPRA